MLWKHRAALIGVRINNVLTSLQQQILDYVRGNWNAAETAKGVNHVWLNRPPTRLSIAEVEQALEGLVAEGMLEKHSLPGSTVVYRISQGPRNREA